MTKQVRILSMVSALVVVIAASAVAQPGGDATELVGTLTKELGVTEDQARGGAGALFGLAKRKMEPSQFDEVAKHVPGMDGLLKGAPDLGGDATGGKLGTMAAAAGAFKKLGLQPSMATKFVPVLTQFVGGKGGSGVASMLAGALK
jgi:hypothetical protein